ncbi:MAG TPA: hypothetical protein VIC61_04665 [Gammaproteobacteria bacterium]
MSDDGSTAHNVTIHLVHGDAIRFRVQLPEWRLLGLGGDIEKAQLRNMMVIELDGKLVMIPYSNIRSIEIDPAPPELPKHILRRAKSH